MKTKFIILEIYKNGLTAFKSERLFFGSTIKKAIFKLGCILIMLCNGIIGHAQQPVQVNDAVYQLLSSTDPILKEKGIQLNQLIDDANPNLLANPTLLINENGFKKIDGDAPIALIVKKNAIEQLYSQHADFENIQMIRIVAENETDLNLIIDLKKLVHFPNLKYIYFYTLFEVCPGNPDNKVCHATIFNNMVSGIEETTNIQVVFKVSFVQ